MPMFLRREILEAKKLSVATHNKKVGYRISKKAYLEGSVTHNHK